MTVELDSDIIRQVKWRQAVKPVPVHPIATFEQREANYRREMRAFHLRECSWMFALCALMSFDLAYLFTLGSTSGVQPPDFDWRLLGLIMAVALMIPPYCMMKPQRPRYGDVDQERDLRRAVGMDDTLAE